eukprot:scaffold10729_cov91-Skeletonema_dohrnii-CCMP3373.AAC.6
MCIINSDRININNNNNTLLPAPTTTSAPKNQIHPSSSMKVLSIDKRISLWLLPPEPILSSLTRTQQQLISLHDSVSNNKLPTFTPHVTLVGGVPISKCCTVEDDVMPLLTSCNDNNNNGREHSMKQEEEEEDVDEVAAKSVLMRLACAFRNFGGVDCNFVKERGVFAARNDDGEVQWNQSCISIMERTGSLTKAMELAEHALFTKQSTTTTTQNESGESSTHSLERHFKPPACEPHYSFVYGNDAGLIASLLQPSSTSVGSQLSSGSANEVSSGGKKRFVLECPPNFTCTEIAVVWTYPSSLEGVEQWREIGRFRLVEEGGTSKY